jgi:cell division protein FtsI/penicillin-binding protein 2
VTDVIAKSSNVGTAHIALMIGPLRRVSLSKNYEIGAGPSCPAWLSEAESALPPARQKN